MTIYGLDIPNDSAFWDEVKLRAMNNYGDWEAKNIGLAIAHILEDIEDALIDSPEAKQLEKEIEGKQA